MNQYHGPEGHYPRNNSSILKSGLVVAGAAIAAMIVIDDLKDKMAELNPLSDMEIHSVEQIFDTPPHVEIIKIEPINLDCRATVTAHVPIHGRKEHKFLGKVIRTDTVDIDATGDIDVCIEGEPDIIDSPDGSIITINAENVVFHRPRVIQEATTFHYDPGLLGELAHAFPGLSNDEDLSENGLALVQNIIGSSQCMDDAYQAIQETIVTAYKQQAKDKGTTILSVDFVDGDPNYGEFSDLGDSDIDGMSFAVGDEGITCRPASN